MTLVFPLINIYIDNYFHLASRATCAPMSNADFVV